MKWVRYTELEPYRRLKEEGRELLGKEIFITEKRDGSNISIWIDEVNDIHISSHNLEKADDNLIEMMKSTEEYEKIIEYLKDEIKYGKYHIAYGELICAGKGPTRIEPKHKKATWILFDIRTSNNDFMNYIMLFQTAYHYKIPIVKCWGTEMVTSWEELVAMREKWLKYCRRHRREGFVGKNYTNQVFFKEKVDIPKLERKNNVQRIDLPDMPTERCMRALQHAWDEIDNQLAQGDTSKAIKTQDAWKDKSLAMPIIAKHFSMEAKEHNFKMASPYWWYVNTSIDKIKGGEKSE